MLRVGLGHAYENEVPLPYPGKYLEMAVGYAVALGAVTVSYFEYWRGALEGYRD